jgi:ATP-dependent helicase HepA
MNSQDESRPIFPSGKQVRRRSSRDQVGIITSSPKRVGGEWWYPVFFGGNRATNIPESDLELYTAGGSIEDLLREGVFAAKETLSKLITFTKLQYPLRDNLYAIRATRTQFLHYQFKPLLKFLDSPKQRLLIADEVGLGKTIEAGLILVELRARHPESLDRVLVVCPSALCGKWRTELKSRFDEDFKIFDADDVRTFLQDFDANGEATKLRGICSIQMLRGQQIVDEWEAVSPTLDLLVIDEAHHLRNPDTLSHRMGRILGENADSILLLTATPIHLGNVNLFYLLRILDPEQFGTNPAAMRDEVGEFLFQRLIRANEPVIEALRVLRTSIPADFQRCQNLLLQAAHSPEAERFTKNPLFQDALRKLRETSPDNRRDLIELQRDIANLNLLGSALTRTRKREVETRVMREPRVIRVGWTKEEQDFYDAVTNYVLSRYQALAGEPFAAFLTMMPQRQVASCIPAVVERYEHDLFNEVGGLDAELSDLQPEDWTNEAGSATPVAPELDLRQVILRWKAAGSSDTKFQELLNAIRLLDEAEPDRKVLIFAYFKPTLYYLSRRLTEAGYRNEVISGDYSDEERQESIKRFHDDARVRILLSSEVGSEGLDFQFCHVMVNYDLPWNPMVVEQRIGRLDRIGQKSDKIIIFNFSVPGTIEDRIFTRLYQRIRIFEESIGDLEPILGEEIKNLTRDLLSSQLTPKQQEERINQTTNVLEQRRQELAELESKSVRFLGHDEFFTEEMDRVLKKKRYISAEELQTFLLEFLAKHFPACLLESILDNQFELTVSDELEQFVARQIPSDDQTLLEFRRRCGRRAVRLTFDSDIALNDREIDFVTIHHPLIRAIVRHYEEHQEELHPVARVTLPSELISREESLRRLESGDYLYFIYRLEIQGTRSERTLQAVFVRADTGTPLSRDLSEDVLSEMVTKGSTPETVPDCNPNATVRAQGIADSEFGDYLEKRKSELTKLNEAMVNSKLISLEQSYAIKVAKKEHQLISAREKKSPARYIQMLEGTVRRLRFDYEKRKEEVERGRNLDLSFERVAAGILTIR